MDDRWRLVRGHGVTQAEAHGKGEASRRERDSVRGAYLDSDNAVSLGGSGGTGRNGTGVERESGVGWDKGRIPGPTRGKRKDQSRDGQDSGTGLRQPWVGTWQRLFCPKNGVSRSLQVSDRPHRQQSLGERESRL